MMRTMVTLAMRWGFLVFNDRAVGERALLNDALVGADQSVPDVSVAAGKRCYNWPDCTGSKCTRVDARDQGGVDHTALLEDCRKDPNCGYVSCHLDLADTSKCQRYMTSLDCEAPDNDDEPDWVIHGQHKVAEGKRCYGWPGCTAPKCTRVDARHPPYQHQGGADHLQLLEECRIDPNCGYVSCHLDLADPSKCQRFMKSLDCDAGNNDDEPGWVIHREFPDWVSHEQPEPLFSAVGKRCYNWPQCTGPVCTRVDARDQGGVDHTALLDKCRIDPICGYVSCHVDLADPSKCQRYMTSLDCDAHNNDDEPDWIIHAA